MIRILILNKILLLFNIHASVVDDKPGVHRLRHARRRGDKP